MRVVRARMLAGTTREISKAKQRRAAVLSQPPCRRCANFAASIQLRNGVEGVGLEKRTLSPQIHSFGMKGVLRMQECVAWRGESAARAPRLVPFDRLLERARAQHPDE
eukprot:6192930-Pleurochrysis_carterae.AAC.6